MKTGILSCENLTPELRKISGDFSSMFLELLGQYPFEFEPVVFQVREGEYPAAIDDCDGYLCTGSFASVYDEEAWIGELSGFVRELYEKRKKFVGICFGHQIIAHALGGLVRAAPDGWGLGIRRIRILQEQSWMKPFQPELNLMFFHQDQVITPPPRGRILACAAHCPCAVFQVDSHFLGIQAHPEFSPDFVHALALANEYRIGHYVVNRALATFHQAAHRRHIAGWIMRFLCE